MQRIPDAQLRPLHVADRYVLTAPVHYGYAVERASCRTIDGSLAGGGGAGDLLLCPLQLEGSP